MHGGGEGKAEFIFSFFDKGGEPTSFIKGLNPCETIYAEKSTVMVFSPCNCFNFDEIVGLMDELKAG